MPVYIGEYEPLYRDTKGDSRTCLNCGRLVREESDRPVDAWFADSYRSTIGDAYQGVRHRYRRYTATHADEVFCKECGTIDSHTYLSTEETLSTGEVLNRVEDVLDSIEKLHGVPIDRDQAVNVAKGIKQDPDRTSTPADEIIEHAVGFGVERAVYLAER